MKQNVPRVAFWLTQDELDVVTQALARAEKANLLNVNAQRVVPGLITRALEARR